MAPGEEQDALGCVGLIGCHSVLASVTELPQVGAAATGSVPGGVQSPRPAPCMFLRSAAGLASGGERMSEQKNRVSLVRRRQVP